MSRVFEEVAEVIGIDSASELSRRFGGVPLRIPMTPQSGSVLVLAIGQAKAEKLCRVYGQCTIQLPSRRSNESAVRKREIESDIRSGGSYRDIAISHGVTVQCIYKIASKMRSQ